MGAFRLTYLPGLLMLALLGSPSVVYAEVDKGEESSEFVEPAPPTLAEIQEIEALKNFDSDEESALPVDIRLEAVKEAALSYGARGGLASRSFEIRRDLDKRSSYLDKVYDFRRLLIAAPSGLLLEPPIISESLNALLIENDGQAAAVSDAIYMINQNAKIVSAPRQWRSYLERGWGVVEKPPEILLPQTAEERKIWRELAEKGWIEGRKQADEVFEQDLNRLSAEFSGMVRYRQLLAQGMVSPPFAQQLDRGVTGVASNTGNNGAPITSTMRVGDRAVVITGVPELITGSDQWRPASR